MIDPHPPLTLTGKTWTENRELLTAGISVLGKSAKPPPDDVKLYFRHDAAGTAAMRGGHTNFGFSGWIAASVSTGSRWARLDLKTLLATGVGHFAKKEDLAEAARAVEKALGKLAGTRVFFKTTKYSLSVETAR